MFANMKVSLRLGLGFGLVLLLMAVLIAIGLNGMSEIKARLDGVLNENNVKMELATEMRGAVRDVALAVRNAVLLEETSEMQGEIKRIEEQQKKYNDAEAKLTVLVTRPEGKAMLAKAKDAESMITPLIEKVGKLALSNQDKEAVALLLKEVRPAQKKWLDALDEIRAFQTKNSADDAEEAAQAYASALRLLLTVGAVALVAGIVTAVWLTYSLLKQLGGEPAYAAEVVSKVAAGDLTVEVRTKSGDTTSMLAAIRSRSVTPKTALCNDSILSSSGNVRRSRNSNSGRSVFRHGPSRSEECEANPASSGAET